MDITIPCCCSSSNSNPDTCYSQLHNRTPATLANQPLRLPAVHMQALCSCCSPHCSCRTTVHTYYAAAAIATAQRCCWCWRWQYSRPCQRYTASAGCSAATYILRHCSSNCYNAQMRVLAMALKIRLSKAQKLRSSWQLQLPKVTK